MGFAFLAPLILFNKSINLCCPLLLLNQSINQYLLPSDHVILHASNGVFVIYYSVDMPGERAKFKHDNEVSLMVHQAIVDRMQSKICDVLFVLLAVPPCLCQRIMGNFPKKKSNKLHKFGIVYLLELSSN